MVIGHSMAGMATMKLVELGKKPHVPILFIGGGSDNIFPPVLTKTIAGKYRDPNSKVDIKIFEGKSHFICGEEGWESVADYILDWYEKV
ncbi:MAG TPA: hypothetical protein VFZ47_00590 [Chitinophagaceae bacterium]